MSDVVETDPVGGPEQPPYLNAVAVGRATLAPADLLAALHAIEAEHGRTREIRWGARTLDLDLDPVRRPRQLAAKSSATTRALLLPHPRAHERAFVLVPWADADPRATLRVGAGDGGIRPVVDLLADLDRSGVRPGPRWEQQ